MIAGSSTAAAGRSPAASPPTRPRPVARRSPPPSLDCPALGDRRASGARRRSAPRDTKAPPMRGFASGHGSPLNYYVPGLLSVCLGGVTLLAAWTGRRPAGRRVATAGSGAPVAKWAIRRTTEPIGSLPMIAMLGLVVHPRRELDGALETLRRWSSGHGVDVVQVPAAGQDRTVAQPGDPA